MELEKQLELKKQLEKQSYMRNNPTQRKLILITKS